MTSVVACVYKHPAKNQTCLPILLSGFLLLPRPCFMAFTRKNNKQKGKKKVKGWNKGWKKMGKQKLSKKKGISQKLHLPRSRIHRSRCRSRSRCLPWPAVTQRPLRSLRNSKGMKSCNTLSYVIFVTCFISFPDFSSTFHWFDIFDPYLSIFRV